MSKFNFQINNKIAVWQKMDVNVECDSHENAKKRIIELVKTSPVTLDDGKDDVEFLSVENDCCFEEIIPATMNKGFSTSEILDNGQLIYENGNNNYSQLQDLYNNWFNHSSQNDAYYIMEINGKENILVEVGFSRKEILSKLGMILISYDGEQTISLQIIKILKATADSVPLYVVLRKPEVYGEIIQKHSF